MLCSYTLFEVNKKYFHLISAELNQIGQRPANLQMQQQVPFIDLNKLVFFTYSSLDI